MYADELMAAAERIMKRASEKGADSAEVFFLDRRSDSYSIEKNVINFTSGSVEKGFGIRVLKGGKIGFSYATTEEKAMQAVEKALSLSSLSRVQEGFAFNQPGDFPGGSGVWDPKIPDMDPEQGAELAKEMIEAATAVDENINVAGGGLEFGYYHTGIVNTEGLAVSDRGTFAGAGIYSVLMRDEVSTGSEDVLSRRLDLDFQWIGRRASEKAVESYGPVKLEKGGKIPVIFANTSLNQMFEFIIVPALHGEAAGRGESVYSGKIGQQVADPKISIIDDGLMPDGIHTQKMDDEGVPSRRTVVVENGILKTFLYDLASAARFKAEPTGNGVRAQRLSATNTFKSPPTTGGRNITIKAETKDLETLISEIDYGVIVHSVLGAHTSNPASGDFSVNSSNLFLIEKGEVTKPVKSAMLGGNMPQALASVTGVANDYKVMKGHIYFMGSKLPSIAVDGVNVTG